MIKLKRIGSAFPIQPLVKTETEVEVERPIQRISTEKTSFQTLVERAAEINAQCYDYTAPWLNMDYDAESNKALLKFMSDKPEEKMKIRKSFLTPYSLGQLCTKVGVPASYVNKCLATEGYQDLAGINVNKWLERYKSPLFVRTYNDCVRGILSTRYQTFDTDVILSECLKVDGSTDYKIKGFYLDEERFHVRAILPKRLKVDGEDLFPGFSINSSDVGRSALVVTFFIFKQVCTNGLCVAKGNGTLFSQKHIGVKPNNFREALVAAFKEIPELTANVEKLITTSRDTGLIKGSRTEDEYIKEIVKQVTTNVAMSETEALKVVDVMREKYSENNWGLINAITEVAQEHTLERRLEIERLAGNMLYKGVLVA